MGLFPVLHRRAASVAVRDCLVLVGGWRSFASVSVVDWKGDRGGNRRLGSRAAAAAIPARTDSLTHQRHRNNDNHRREAILKAHPEIRKLFGPCPWTKYKAAAVIFTQVGTSGRKGLG